MRKTTFFELFTRRSAKSDRKQRFFHVFRDTLYKVRKKKWKTAFFWATLCKKCEKTVFFHVFQDTLYKVRRKWEKSAYFELFLRRSPKSVSKQCFLSSFETLCTKFAENAENSVSELFLRRSAQSVRKLCFFHFFMRRSAKSVKKQCFFTFFRNTLYKVRRKCEKQRILSFLLDVPQKVLENSVFSRFSRHFVHS